MIGKVIKSKFADGGELETIFGNRVSPLVGLQTKARPFAIYEVVEIGTNTSKESDSHIDEIDVRITMISDNYSDVQTGVDAIRSTFVRMNETVSGVKVKSCAFDGQRDLYSDNEKTFATQVDLKFRVSRD